jgi:hypothetical protein
MLSLILINKLLQRYKSFVLKNVFIISDLGIEVLDTYNRENIRNTERLESSVL